jgi:hypothetical protein
VGETWDSRSELVLRAGAAASCKTAVNIEISYQNTSLSSNRGSALIKMILYIDSERII